MATLLNPAGLPGTSRTLVFRVGDSLDGAAFPVMDLLDILPGVLDLTAPLALLGLTIAATPVVSRSASLAIDRVTFTASGVITLRIAPVSLPADVPSVRLLIPLSDGDRLNLVVLQPVEDRTPAGMVPIGSSGTTADSTAITSDSAFYTADAGSSGNTADSTATTADSALYTADAA